MLQPSLSPLAHRHLPISSPQPHPLLPSLRLPVLSPKPTVHAIRLIHPASTNSAIYKSQNLPSVSSVSCSHPILVYLLICCNKDQAVKALCDIWPQQDIPTVFLTSDRPVVPPMSGSEQQHPTNTLHSTSRNTHLPSPISPTTQHTPVTSPVAPHASQAIVYSQHHQCETAPMKGFVHEVIRRSRTSGSVLQTALCYLEAIRSKVPDLVREENQAFSSSPVVSDNDRISQGEVGVDYESDLGSPAPSTDMLSSDIPLATVRIDSILQEADASFALGPGLDADKVPVYKSKTDDSLPPLPPLPSPLLCPRRTFLASLILASKFMQDRCYSNRAWAKLSGLPPREIGRCERALGEALEWRLWVGKLPAAQSTSGRALTKCKSESNIHFSGNPPLAIDADLSSPPGPRISSLRRSATLPAGTLYFDGPCVNGINNTSPTAYSSSPSTPGLSYSPTPTESSLGDRTVQMTTFMDVSTPPPGQFATFPGAQNDKVLATLSVPSNGLYVYTSSQDIALPLSQTIDSQFLVSHGVVPPNSVWMFHNDA
ncbi:hypothetical protein JVT61DRAFT_13834 [Boletus reticuloceps]|uniref:G1/S-specific cyclin pas1 n=1 Tax=Boletus reticuloceps TaxID=495285 RepID=A0A8I2YTM2_9AGAM|nr:hypothetical protein JVT61DRAFT_13834 [Boletus reticuloceps]